MKSLLIEPLEARIAPATLTIAPASVTEGDSGTKTLTFTVTLDAPATGVESVQFATEDNASAIAGSDYVSNTGTLTFAAGEVTKTIDVIINGDLTGEADETFLVRLSNASGATLGTSQATGTILNDAKLSISTPTAITEGDSGLKTLGFVVSLVEADPAATVEVNYRTVDGTATVSDQDYVQTNDKLTFLPGETSKSLSVTINGDTVGEEDETFSVELLTPVGATITTATGVGTILNDAKFSVATPAAFFEAESGTKTLDFVITLSEGKPTGTATVKYATADGTAVAGTDYNSVSGEFTFAPGETTKTVSVTIKADTVNEADENFKLLLSEPTGAVLASTQATGTIVDPKLSISGPTTVTESGTSQVLEYTVTLDHAYPGSLVTVNYSTVAGTALAGTDFTATSGTLTFDPGQTTKTIQVTVLGDSLKEPTESFSVQLSNSTNAFIGTGTATTSITDDELDPIYVSDVTLTEGDSGNTVAIFTITLASAVPSGQKLVVNYATKDGTAISVGDVNDYTAVAGSVTFAAGELTKTVSVTIRGDRNYEGATFVGTGASQFAADQFTLELGAAELRDATSDAKIRDITFSEGSKTIGTATIRDNDVLPTVSIADARFLEGNGGGTSEGTFAVTLSEATDYPIELVYSTTGGSATQGTDYTGGTNLTVTIPAGVKVFQLPIPIAADDLQELSENFTVSLVSATLKPANQPTQSLGITRAQAVGTIVDDEITVTLEPTGSISVPEGDTGTTDLVFTVKLSKPTTQALTVNYAAQDLSAISSGALADYTLPAGQLNFAPGEDSKTITIKINGDTRIEGTETFRLVLSAENVSLGGASGTLTQDVSITEEAGEPQPTVTISNVTPGGQIVEGGAATFQVTLSGPTTEAVVVTYKLQDGTAKSGDAGNDYTNGTDLKVTIPAGQTSATFTVTTLDDVLNEGDVNGLETFTAKIESATNAIVPTEGIEAVGNIKDNDEVPSLSVGNATIIEGNSGTKTMSFVVTLSAVSGRDVTFKASTVDGVALAGQDYEAKEQVFTIPAGERTATFQVTVNGDTVNEADENLFVRLSDAQNASIAIPQGVGVIQNDESTFEVRFFNPITGQFDLTSMSTEEEGGDNNDQEQTVRFKVFRTGDLTIPATVSFTTADGVDRRTGDDRVRGAVGTGSRADFALTSGSISFAATTEAGVTQQSSDEFSFKINKDNYYEKLEEFFVRLEGGVNGAPSSATDAGRVQIVDNEALPTLTLTDAKVNEGNLQSSGSAQQTNMVFTAKLSHVDETGTWQLTQRTVDGTGETGAISTVSNAKRDFVSIDGTALNFAPGETSKNVTVTVLGDARDEYDETLQVQIAGKNSAGTDITTLTGTGTITDDDAEAVVNITNLVTGSTFTGATFAESDAGSNSKFFRVSLTGATDKVVTVKYFSTDGSGLGGAIAGEDFIGAMGTLTFDPNNSDTAARTSQNILVTVINDTIVEGDQSFEMSLQDVTGAKMGDSLGTATIADDANDKPVFTIGNVTLVEGDSPALPQFANFPVVLATAAQKPVMLNYTTADGTGKATGAFADYIAASGQFEFAPGETTKDVQVEVISDEYREADETFTLKLSGLASNSSDVVFASNGGVGTATIQNGSDSIVGIGISDTAQVENGRDSSGSNTSSTASFTVELSIAQASEVKVTAGVRSGTATKGVDFSNTSSVVTIPANTLTGTFSVALTADNVFEPTETFFADLSQIPAGIVGAKTSGKGTIYNDDVRQISARKVQWIDNDGDLVTLKISKGELNIFNGNQFSFYDAGSTVGGLSLQILNLNSDEYAGANVTITAERQPGFTGDQNGELGDGRVDIGFIRAGSFASDGINFFGVDLGTVKIDGDLGKIEVGDRFIDGVSFRKLDVFSVGRNPIEEGLGSFDSSNNLTGVEISSYIQGKVGEIRVRTDFSGAFRVVGDKYGDVGSLFIGGTLLGTEYSSSGSISFSGLLGRAEVGGVQGGSGGASGRIDGDSTYGARINNLYVEGSVQGGSGANSGVIAASSVGKVDVGSIIGGSAENSGQIRAGSIKKVHIASDLIGGAGAKSGYLEADSDLSNGGVSLGNVTVKGRIIGGAGTDSGVVTSDNALNSITVRGKLSEAPDVTLPDVTAAVSGGSGTTSGRIHASGNMGHLEIIGTNDNASLQGGVGTGSAKITTGSLKTARLTGDIRGAAVSSTGLIDVFGAINSLILKGDLIGGNSRGEGPDASLSGVNTTGAIVAGSIKSLQITGDLVSGQNTGEGLGGSGSIAAQGPIGKLQIDGDIIGNATRAVNILAFGGTDAPAIKNLKFGGDVSFANVFTGTSIRNNSDGVSVVNADAVIKDVVIDGNVKGLNITAGANAGPDGTFGTADDRVSSNSQGQINEPKEYSRIASVIIRGQVQAVTNGDTVSPYGIIAQQIGSIRVGSQTVPLTPGPGNDTADSTTDETPGAEIVVGTGFRAIELPIP